MGFRLPLVLMAFAAALAADSALAADKPLFTRMGGRAVIFKATQHFLDSVRGDPKLMQNASLKETADTVDRKRLSLEITERVCAVSGGAGCAMKPGLIERLGPKIKLSTMEWFSVVSHLNEALTKYNVPRREQAEFVALVLKAKP